MHTLIQGKRSACMDNIGCIMDQKILICLITFSFLSIIIKSQTWSGKVCTASRIQYWIEKYCSSYFIVCTYESYRLQGSVVTEFHCCPGWTESNPQHCDVPICSPSCEPRGTCVAPNRCNCNKGYTGENTACTTLKCSHLIPCFPGTCMYNATSDDTCECDTGFSGTGQDACLTMTKEKGMPDIILSTVTLSHIKRTDNSKTFFFAMDGTTENNDTFWINQKDFNHIIFEMHSLYEPPPLSYRPYYIHDAGFGIVGGQIFLNISKIPRGGTIRDVAFTNNYTCPGLSDTDPNKNIAKCIINETQFYTNFEDGDWFSAEFTARSGGFRNVLQPNITPFIQIYRGQTDQKVVEFKFDFEVPKHCSEENITEICTPDDFPLRIETEFTKLPIIITWGGWTDIISGMKKYHLEIFKLSVDLYGNLTEITPLNPAHSADIKHTHINTYRYVHKPLESGMYSVLLQATDKANNSKIARRLVLYDPNSTISVNVEDDNTFYVSSAVPETGYMWQSAKNGTKIECTVQWTNHFSNKFISDGKLLNKVNAYPSQFENFEREGILKTKKVVYQGFDDNEGERTVEEKPNKNGIVLFEVNIIYTNDIDEPVNGWRVNGLSDRYTFSAVNKDGKSAHIWVRAYDVLGNKMDDSAIVYFDSTPPVLSNNSTFARNQKGTYNHTSRLTFDAWDADSGVYKIEFKLIRNDNYQIIYNSSASASVQNISCNSKECKCVLEKCFIAAQILDLDNCWFMMAEEDLDKVNVTVEVTVYNQALLETKLSVTVDKIYGLLGLEKYSGPENIRSTERNVNSVRLEWDLPETESCYGRTDTVITLYKHDGSTKVYTVSRNTRFVEMIGLVASRDYTVVFSLGFEGHTFGNVSYSFRTTDEDKSAVIERITGGVVAGLIIIVLVIIAIVCYRRYKSKTRELSLELSDFVQERSGNVYQKAYKKQVTKN